MDNDLNSIINSTTGYHLSLKSFHFSHKFRISSLGAPNCSFRSEYWLGKYLPPEEIRMKIEFSSGAPNGSFPPVNYLFGRPLIPYEFLKGIFTSNFRDMGNLRLSVFGLIKMSFRVRRKKVERNRVPSRGRNR